LNSTGFRPMPLVGTILLASALWFVTFYLTWSIFWIKISFSAASLAILSFWLQPYPRQHLKFNGSAIIIGLLSAAFLYLIFWTGKAVSAAILPFSGQQIGGIYAKGTGTSMWMIALLLFFITGPAEELYWRGYLQKKPDVPGAWLYSLFFRCIKFLTISSMGGFSARHLG